MASVAIGLILTALGLGAFSSLSFVWQWMFGAPGRTESLVLLLVVAASGIAAFRSLRRRLPSCPVRPGIHWIAFAILCAYMLYLLPEAIRSFSHGGADAYAVWNLHARFLYRGAAVAWKDVFASPLGWTQNDYPLMLPGLVAGSWRIFGAESGLVPPILGVIFTLLAIGIVITAVLALSGDGRGWIAGIILLATPSFVGEPVVQGADLPLSLYILTAVVLLQLAQAWPQLKTPLLVMAGAAAGFAGWTKNEGTLFILVILASHFAGAALRRGWAEYPRELLRLAIGLAPGILLLGAFRLFLSPPSDVQLDSAALHRLTVVDRYPQVVAGFVDKFKAFGGWWNSGIHPGVVVVLFLLLYLTSIRNIKATSLNLLFVPLFMMAGYFMVYIITPYELQWHINTSLDRLLLQLWPASVFILSAISVTRESADVQAGTLVLEHP